MLEELGRYKYLSGYYKHRSIFKRAGSESCTSCPAGSECPEMGVSEPVLCKPGFYTDILGAVSCVPCSSGSFNNKPGTIYYLI